ncbi:MAG TPA: tetratricopeptide repeat protein [Candidatus Acidoferrum sp.]|nr:tetratricopeptide repeat protein [Candidatus Acidoferrum sp.]
MLSQSLGERFFLEIVALMAALRTTVKVGMALGVYLVAGLCARGACLGPAALEAKVRSRPGAENYAQLGMWFGNRHEYACAIESFRSALKFDPSSPRLYYLVGLSLYASGNPEQAVSPLEKAIDLAPDNLDSHLILGSALTQLQHLAEAAAQWEAALKIDPSSKIALDGLSKCLIAAGQYNSAIALLTSTPRDENMTLDLAEAYGKNEQLDQAVNVLKPALQSDPSSVRLANALVTVYVEQRRIQDAVQIAKNCAAVRPNDVAAKGLYLHILIVDGQFDQARPLAKKLLAAAPNDFDALYLNGILEREAGDYVIARRHLDRAIAINPTHANARYNLGMDLVQLKDYPEAKRQLETAIQLGVAQPSIRFELAKVLRNMGDTQGAQQQLQIYQQQVRDRANRTLAASKAAQGDQEIAKGDLKRAADLYREAAAALTTDAYLQYKLALILDSMGDIEGENTALQQAIRIDPDFALAQYQLGYLASRSGDLSSAEKDFRTALRAAPGYTKAWVSLAAALAMDSQFAEAQKAVAVALRLDPGDEQAQQLRRDLMAAQARP